MAVVQFLTRAATRNERKNSQSLAPDFTSISVGGAAPITISKDGNGEFDFGAVGLANLGLDATPTNYSPTDANKLADHLAAIDTALASAGGTVFSDADFELQDNVDSTKAGKFVLDNVPTSTSINVSWPDVAVDLKDIVNVYSLAGVSQSAVDLGTFSGTAGTLITANADIKQALQNLGDSIGAQEFQDSVIDKDLTAPPVGPSTGDRYLIGTDTGDTAATGAWAGEDGNIAEWDGSAWVFTTPTTGSFVAADDETNVLYLFGGTTWVSKAFESTTASGFLSKDGVDIQLTNLTSANFILGDGSNDAQSVTMSGDATMDNAGALSLAANSVAAAEIDASVAGDGLAGGGGSALSVNVDDGLRIVSDNVQRDDAVTAQNDHGSTVTIRNIVRFEGDGNFVLADKSDAGLDEGTRFAIVEDASIASLASGRVILRGGALIGGFTGLTPSSPVYLGAAGAIVQDTAGFTAGTDSVVRIGYAHSATQIELAPEYETLF